MKTRLFFLTAVCLAMTACTTRPDKSSSTDPDSSLAAAPVENQTEPAAETLCFLKTDGTSNQDSTRLRLIISGDQVSGDLGHYPFEKDRRVGTIAGTKDGNLIRGQWYFMQEGMNDTLQIEFKLNSNKLVQKNYTIDPKTGREVLSEASVFNVEFTKVDCRD